MIGDLHASPAAGGEGRVRAPTRRPLPEPSPGGARGGRARLPILAVATLAEALPLAGLHPVVVGVGRREYPITTAMISAGFAGACQPWLRPGDLLLVGGEHLRGALGAVEGALRTVEHIADPYEKAAYGREGAAAVDMETAWLAEAAARAGQPFLGVRVIIDRLGDGAISVATARHYVRAARRMRQAVRQALRLWP